MTVPIETFEKYYDVNEVDDQGKYKAWLLGIEKYEALKRIHHFIPFSTTHKESIPKWSVKKYNFSYNPTWNVTPDSSPKSSPKSQKSWSSWSKVSIKSLKSSQKKPKTKKKSPHSISNIFKWGKEREEEIKELLNARGDWAKFNYLKLKF